jgi:hypothetical protein
VWPVPEYTATSDGVVVDAVVSSISLFPRYLRAWPVLPMRLGISSGFAERMRSGRSGFWRRKDDAIWHCICRTFFDTYPQGRMIMEIIKRQPGDRRMGLPLEFPLVDGDDVFVVRDRRSHQERRVAGFTLEEIEVLLSQLLHKGSYGG